MSLAKLNKKIEKLGIKAELVKGTGYFYFVGDDVEHAPSTSVYVNTFSELSTDVWLEELRECVSQSLEVKSYYER